jgi:hypothetical protein
MVRDEKTKGQLRVIRTVIAVTRAAGIPAWLFGGWGLDARIGRITREHGDVEFWVERVHAERSKLLLARAGATALDAAARGGLRVQLGRRCLQHRLLRPAAGRIVLPAAGPVL